MQGGVPTPVSMVVAFEGSDRLKIGMGHVEGFLE